MENEVVWYKPNKCINQIGIKPGEIVITKARIYIAEDVASGIGADRVAIGTSSKRTAIFLKKDAGGYKIRNVKKHKAIEMGGTVMQKAVHEITRGQRVQREAARHADGSFVVFL